MGTRERSHDRRDGVALLEMCAVHEVADTRCGFVERAHAGSIGDGRQPGKIRFEWKHARRIETPHLVGNILRPSEIQSIEAVVQPHGLRQREAVVLQQAREMDGHHVRDGDGFGEHHAHGGVVDRADRADLLGDR